MDSPEQKPPQNIPDLNTKPHTPSPVINSKKIDTTPEHSLVPPSNQNFIIPALPDKPKKHLLTPIQIASLMMVSSIGMLLIAGFLFIKSQNTPEKTIKTPDNNEIPINQPTQTKQNKTPTPTASNKLIFSTITQAPKATPEPKAPLPTRNPESGNFACDPNGICNNYTDPITFGQCPKTFADPKCMDECDDKNIWCAN
jgi:cytoskeletal protein RodZ